MKSPQLFKRLAIALPIILCGTTSAKASLVFLQKLKAQKAAQIIEEAQTGKLEADAAIAQAKALGLGDISDRITPEDWRDLFAQTDVMDYGQLIVAADELSHHAGDFKEEIRDIIPAIRVGTLFDWLTDWSNAAFEDNLTDNARNRAKMNRIIQAVQVHDRFNANGAAHCAAVFGRVIGGEDLNVAHRAVRIDEIKADLARRFVRISVPMRTDMANRMCPGGALPELTAQEALRAILAGQPDHAGLRHSQNTDALADQMIAQNESQAVAVIAVDRDFVEGQVIADGRFAVGQRGAVTARVLNGENLNAIHRDITIRATKADLAGRLANIAEATHNAMARDMYDNGHGEQEALRAILAAELNNAGLLHANDTNALADRMLAGAGGLSQANAIIAVDREFVAGQVAADPRFAPAHFVAIDIVDRVLRGENLNAIHRDIETRRIEHDLGARYANIAIDTRTDMAVRMYNNGVLPRSAQQALCAVLTAQDDNADLRHSRDFNSLAGRMLAGVGGTTQDAAVVAEDFDFIRAQLNGTHFAQFVAAGRIVDTCFIADSIDDGISAFCAATDGIGADHAAAYRVHIETGLLATAEAFHRARVTQRLGTDHANIRNVERARIVDTLAAAGTYDADITEEMLAIALRAGNAVYNGDYGTHVARHLLSDGHPSHAASLDLANHDMKAAEIHAAYANIEDEHLPALTAWFMNNANPNLVNNINMRLALATLPQAAGLDAAALDEFQNAVLNPVVADRRPINDALGGNIAAELIAEARFHLITTQAEADTVLGAIPDALNDTDEHKRLFVEMLHLEILGANLQQKLNLANQSVIIMQDLNTDIDDMHGEYNKTSMNDMSETIALNPRHAIHERIRENAGDVCDLGAFNHARGELLNLLPARKIHNAWQYGQALNIMQNPLKHAADELQTVNKHRNTANMLRTRLLAGGAPGGYQMGDIDIGKDERNVRYMDALHPDRVTIEKLTFDHGAQPIALNYAHLTHDDIWSGTTEVEHPEVSDEEFADLKTAYTLTIQATLPGTLNDAGIPDDPNNTAVIRQANYKQRVRLLQNNLVIKNQRTGLNEEVTQVQADHIYYNELNPDGSRRINNYSQADQIALRDFSQNHYANDFNGLFDRFASARGKAEKWDRILHAILTTVPEQTVDAKIVRPGQDDHDEAEWTAALNAAKMNELMKFINVLGGCDDGIAQKLPHVTGSVSQYFENFRGNYSVFPKIAKIVHDWKMSHIERLSETVTGDEAPVYTVLHARQRMRLPLSLGGNFEEIHYMLGLNRAKQAENSPEQILKNMFVPGQVRVGEGFGDAKKPDIHFEALNVKRLVDMVYAEFGRSIHTQDIEQIKNAKVDLLLDSLPAAAWVDNGYFSKMPAGGNNAETTADALFTKGMAFYLLEMMGYIRVNDGVKDAFYPSRKNLLNDAGDEIDEGKIYEAVDATYRHRLAGAVADEDFSLAELIDAY
jgi:hypothetical protein